MIKKTILTLFTGFCTGILFTLLITAWIKAEDVFKFFNIFSTIISILLSIFIVWQTHSNFKKQQKLEETIHNKENAIAELSSNAAIFDKRYEIYSCVVRYQEFYKIIFEKSKSIGQFAEKNELYSIFEELVYDYYIAHSTDSTHHTDFLSIVLSDKQTIKTAEFFFSQKISKSLMTYADTLYDWAKNRHNNSYKSFSRSNDMLEENKVLDDMKTFLNLCTETIT